jgi:Double zinc ribbon
MRCPSCNYDNPGDAWFCEECGAKLELLCPVVPQNLIRSNSLVIFDLLAIACMHGDADKRNGPGRPK